jgi:hypothetical protein
VSIIKIDGYEFRISFGGFAQSFEKDNPIDNSFYNYSGGKTSGVRSLFSTKIICLDYEELLTLRTILGNNTDSLIFEGDLCSQKNLFNNDPANWTNVNIAGVAQPCYLRNGHLRTTGNLGYPLNKPVDYLGISYWKKTGTPLDNISTWDFFFEDSEGRKIKNGKYQSFTSMLNISSGKVTGFTFAHSADARYMDVRVFYGFVSDNYIVSLMQNCRDNPKKISTYPYVYVEGEDFIAGEYISKIVSTKVIKNISDSNIYYEVNVDFTGVGTT